MISDEQLAELADGCMDSIPCPISALYELAERLIAAEADAKRYLHLRNSGMIAAGRVGRHSISIPHYDTTDAERKELDDFLDAAMERTP